MGQSPAWALGAPGWGRETPFLVHHYLGSPSSDSRSFAHTQTSYILAFKTGPGKMVQVWGPQLGQSPGPLSTRVLGPPPSTEETEAWRWKGLARGHIAYSLTFLSGPGLWYCPVLCPRWWGRVGGTLPCWSLGSGGEGRETVFPGAGVAAQRKGSSQLDCHLSPNPESSHGWGGAGSRAWADQYCRNANCDAYTLSSVLCAQHLNSSKYHIWNRGSERQNDWSKVTQ
jgi:hypothetical protein